MKGFKVNNMNFVLLICVLILIIVCCVKKPNEGFVKAVVRCNHALKVNRHCNMKMPGFGGSPKYCWYWDKGPGGPGTKRPYCKDVKAEQNEWIRLDQEKKEKQKLMLSTINYYMGSGKCISPEAPAIEAAAGPDFSGVPEKWEQNLRPISNPEMLYWEGDRERHMFGSPVPSRMNMERKPVFPDGPLMGVRPGVDQAPESVFLTPLQEVEGTIEHQQANVQIWKDCYCAKKRTCKNAQELQEALTKTREMPLCKYDVQGETGECLEKQIDAKDFYIMGKAAGYYDMYKRDGVVPTEIKTTLDDLTDAATQGDIDDGFGSLDIKFPDCTCADDEIWFRPQETGYEDMKEMNHQQPED
jgi:hypothetical protein